jgi:phage-related protein
MELPKPLENRTWFSEISRDFFNFSCPRFGASHRCPSASRPRRSQNSEEESDQETPVLRPLIWMGSSKRNIQGVPKGAQKVVGDELQLIQFGGMPKDAKPFKGVGSGVIEIALRYAGDAYRTVVAVQLGEKIYVLHDFQKKSKMGIATPRQGVELIKQRYAEAKARAKHEEELSGTRV